MARKLLPLALQRYQFGEPSGIVVVGGICALEVSSHLMDSAFQGTNLKLSPNFCGVGNRPIVEGEGPQHRRLPTVIVAKDPAKVRRLSRPEALQRPGEQLKGGLVVGFLKGICREVDAHQPGVVGEHGSKQLELGSILSGEPHVGRWRRPRRTRRCPHEPQDLVEVDAGAASQHRGVLLANEGVWMAPDQLSGAANRLDPDLRLPQVDILQLAADGIEDQRLAVVYRLAKCLGISGGDQICRVGASGKFGNANVEIAGRRHVDATPRRSGAGGICIECQNHLLGEAAQKVEVPLPQSRAAGGYGHRHAGLVQRDDVGVSLDHNRVTGPDDLRLGPMQAVEKARLVIQRPLGRVEILGSVPLEQPRTKADGIATKIVDREHHSAPESIYEAAAPAARRQPGRHHDIVAHTLRAQSINEVVPAGGRVADLESVDDVGVVAAGPQVASRRSGIPTGLQSVVVEGNGCFDSRSERLASFLPLGRIGIWLDIDAGTAGQKLDCFRKREALGVFEEAEDVTRVAAAEAVVQATSGIERHRGGLLVMERADRHHRTPGLANLGDLGYKLEQIGGDANPLDVFSAVGHYRECTARRVSLREGSQPYRDAMTWNRSGHLSRLTDAAIDVAVIGGGIVGGGTALDLAERGASVALVERDDFAAGTSSKSTKLFHGGIRYMPQLRFGLVREGLREQVVLAEIADYLYRPLDFVVPLYKGVSFGDLPRLLGHHRIVPTALRVGLFLYGRLGRRSDGHRRVGAAETRELAPGLLADGLKGAFVYGDAQTDDARLTIGVIKAAVARDAIALNHAEVIKVEPDNGGYRLTMRNMLDGAESTFTARAVVAAPGSCVAPVPLGTPPMPLRYSRGSHLITTADEVGLTESAVVLPETEDRRILYMVPWLGHALIGTTDVASDGENGRPLATTAEIDYLRRHAARYTGVSPVPKTTFAGTRALAATGSGPTSSATRKHVIQQPAPGFFQVAGGKLTGYRRIAEEVGDRAAKAIGLDRPSTTASVAIAGAGGPPGEGRLWSRYGSLANDVAALAEDDPALGESFEDGSLAAEVVYAVSHEAAATVADVTLRRTRLSWLTADHGRAAAAPIADLMAAQLAWDAARRNAEIQRFEEELVAEGL